jgi:iron-sulfur cluster assembly accessory protein
MISINERASEALRDLLAEKEATPTAGLRLAVTKGGCAGWQYEMNVSEPESDDHIIEFDGGRLIVAADSTDRLKDCVVDYEDSLSDAGFRIRNPQAARSCGCGTSFEAVGETPPDPADVEDCGKS